MEDSGKVLKSDESQKSPESARYFRADDIFKRNPHGVGIPVPSWFLNAVGFNISFILIWASCILSLNQASSRWWSLENEVAFSKPVRIPILHVCLVSGSRYREIRKETSNK